MKHTTSIAISALMCFAHGPSSAQQHEPPRPTSDPDVGAPASRPTASRPTARPVERAPVERVPVERVPVDTVPAEAHRKLVDRVKQQGARLDKQQKKLAEQAALLEEMEAERAEQVQSASEQADGGKTFSLYGFFDLNFRKNWAPDDAKLAGALDEEPMFVFGNLNTYLDWKPLSSWRMLAEIRFMLNPLADVETLEVPIQGIPFKRVNVSTTDAASFGERFDYGSIEIERAVIEWTRYSWLSIAAGLFLTPYGIWNIDHGSPTRTMAAAPLLYAASFFPERQLGIKAFGSHPLGDLTLNYALTLSNGRGPTNTLIDTDWDKGIGGRLELSGEGKVPWQVGVSAYTGRYTDNKRVVDVDVLANGSYDVDIQKEVTIRYREVALAVDLDIDAEPVRFQAEVFGNWRHFDDEYRPPAGYYLRVFFSDATPGAVAREPNTVAWGASGLLRYRLPLKGINLRPFASVVWLNLSDNLAEDNLLHLVFGINWRIRGAVVIKAEYHHGHYPNKAKDSSLLVGTADSQMFVSQLAIAF